MFIETFVILAINLPGVLNWGLGFITDLAIFAILALALNFQWGYTGLFNVGVVAFFMLGAYISALLTISPPGEFEKYIGGYSLPVGVGWVGAALGAGLLGIIVAVPGLRLRRDFLAIVTIGLATIFRSVASTLDGLVNRTAGLHAIPRIFSDVVEGSNYRWLLLGISLLSLAAVYVLVRGITASPYGRTLRSVRDNETASAAYGKNVFLFRMSAFAIGGMIMGFAGALWSHNIRAISPAGFTDLLGTFLIWVMVMVGGSGNNRGVILGAFVVGFLWFGMSLFQTSLPEFLQDNVFQIRQFMTGLLIVLFLLFRPKGLIPESARVSRFIPKLLIANKKGTESL